MPSELELARELVRSRAKALRMATTQGRAELRSAGSIGEETWRQADEFAGELTEALGVLERLERPRSAA